MIGRGVRGILRGREALPVRVEQEQRPPSRLACDHRRRHLLKALGRERRVASRGRGREVDRADHAEDRGVLLHLLIDRDQHRAGRIHVLPIDHRALLPPRGVDEDTGEETDGHGDGQHDQGQNRPCRKLKRHCR